MRVLHFTETFLPITETFVYNFIQKSSAVADEVAVACFHEKNREIFPLNKVVVHLLTPKSFFSKRDPLQTLRAIREKVTGKQKWYSQLKKIIDNFRPDVVHCHFGVTGVMFSEFCNHYKLDIPFLTSFYGYDASELPKNNHTYKEGLSLLWRKASYILTEGPALRSKVIALGATEKQSVISPIIIDSKKYHFREHFSRNGQLRFLVIGRFVEKKGFHLFLEAMGRMASTLSPFLITMIGDGPMMNDYKQIIQKYRLESRISFEGFQPLEKCIDLMKQYDVLVHPSVTASNGDSEGGAPTILLEAQLMGIPVITSSHADIPYIMGYDDFIAKENDAEDLCNVIKKFATSANDNYLNAGREKVLADHDMNTNSIYTDILKRAAKQ